MTLSWPDVDSLGLLPSDVCLFDVLSQPVKVPPPILPIKIPCKNDLNEIFDDCSLPSHWGFSIKNPTIESEVSWSSLLSFLHFRRTEFTTDGAVTPDRVPASSPEKNSSSNKDLHPDCIFWNPAKLQAEQGFLDWIFLPTKGCGECCL